METCGPRECPHCRVLNEPGSQTCDCGFVFESGDPARRGAASASMMDDRVVAQQRLGGLVLVLGLAQVLLYAGEAISPSSDAVLFYFDPRIGVAALLSEVQPQADGVSVAQWGATIWQLAIGAALVARRARIAAYLIGEGLLSTPSLLFFAFVVAAHMRPAHAFSVGELGIPLFVFAVFSLLPVGLAVSISRRRLGGVNVRSASCVGRPTTG